MKSMTKKFRSTILARLFTILLALILIVSLSACQPAGKPKESAIATSSSIDADNSKPDSHPTSSSIDTDDPEPDSNATSTRIDAGSSELAEADLEKFLTIFFTSDYEGRYRAFSADQDADSYYAPLKELITDECLDTLMKNREPLKYEKKLAEDESSVRFKNYHTEKSEADFWEGTVTLEESKADGSTEELNYKLQLGLAQVEGKTLINSIYFR